MQERIFRKLEELNKKQKEGLEQRAAIVRSMARLADLVEQYFCEKVAKVERPSRVEQMA